MLGGGSSLEGRRTQSEKRQTRFHARKKRREELQEKGKAALLGTANQGLGGFFTLKPETVRMIRGKGHYGEQRAQTKQKEV